MKRPLGASANQTWTAEQQEQFDKFEEAWARLKESFCDESMTQEEFEEKLCAEIDKMYPVLRLQ